MLCARSERWSIWLRQHLLAGVRIRGGSPVFLRNLQTTCDLIIILTNKLPVLSFAEFWRTIFWPRSSEIREVGPNIVLSSLIHYVRTHERVNGKCAYVRTCEWKPLATCSDVFVLPGLNIYWIALCKVLYFLPACTYILIISAKASSSYYYCVKYYMYCSRALHSISQMIICG